jgi:hypothetical protein
VVGHGGRSLGHHGLKYFLCNPLVSAQERVFVNSSNSGSAFLFSLMSDVIKMWDLLLLTFHP